MQHRKWVILAIIITIGLWGTAFPAIKLALASYSPMEVGTLRFFVAAFVFILLACVNKVRMPPLKDWPIFLLIALTGGIGYHLLLNSGESYTDAGTAGFVVSTSPLFTILLSYVFFKENFSLEKFIGALISLLGVWIIAVDSDAAMKMNAGVIFLLMGALLWSLFFIIQKAALRGYSSIEVITYAVWIAAILFLLFSHPVSLITSIPHRQTMATWAVIYLGIFPTCIAYCTWAYTLKNVNISTASIYTYFIPFISALLAYFFLDEHYTPLFLLGGLLIIIGIVIANNLKMLRRWMRSIAKKARIKKARIT